MIARVRQVSRAAGFVSYTAVSIPAYLAALAAAPEAEREAVSDRWVRRWARTLLRMFAIEPVVDGVAPPATRRGERGRLVVSNHRSAIDIGVMLATFGGTMVSRADLAGWPVVGAAARAVGTVFVDRASAKSGAATIRVIQKHLEQGKTIALFPEGTTFDGDEVRPFHGGAFVAAARAEAEILPVGVAYPKGSGAAFVDQTFPQHLARVAAGGRTRMAVAVGTPFVASKDVRAKTLTDRAHDEVSELVRRARARL
ncbi:MAG TPA: lysophospholipid acyltransferase family protein [Labilithrix sp.]